MGMLLDRYYQKVANWAPMKHRVARLVSPGFKFGVDDPGEAEALVDLGVGGFCLYGGRVGEVKELTERLQKRAREPLLFNADYEDGTGTQCEDGVHLPSNMGIGAAGDEELARAKGRLTAAQSAAIGVRWVLTPVVDLATEPDNPIVNVRSFGADPAHVARMARAYLKGLREGGAIGCLKHFPGHGRARSDSHLEMPAIEAPRAELEADLQPFRELAAEADSLMTGHLSVPALEEDPRLPFSISPAVRRLLREELRYDGLVSTDALTMHAVSKAFDENKAAEMALLGGSDVLLVPVEPKKLVYHLLDRVDKDPVLAAAVEAALRRFDRAAERAAGPAAPFDPAEQRSEARRLAERCLAWAGKPAAPLKKVRYAEPGAAGPEEWQAQAFVDELTKQGAELVEDGALVLGCVVTPRAYTGRIKLDPEGEVAPAQRWLDRGGGVIVSFGSPFIFESFKSWDAGLCAFAADDEAQRAAARALLGLIPVTGRMPVRLRL